MADDKQKQPQVQPQAQSKDEVQTTAPVAAAPQMKEVVQAPISIKDVSATTSSKDAVKVVSQAAQDDQVVLFELNNYYNVVKPGVVVTKEEGAKWDYALYKLFMGILSEPSQELFNKKWGTVLRFFDKNSAVLNGYNISRYPGNWPGSNDEFVNYRRLAFLVIETANVGTRKQALKSISLDKLFSGITQQQSAKLVAFYQV
jgi:hypothetical protein